MQNYRAGPVGPVGARGVPRGTGEGTSGGREVERETRQEGPAAPQPTSTSGLVKVSVAGPSVPLFLLRLRHLVWFLFFLFARPILSLSLFFSPAQFPSALSLPPFPSPPRPAPTPFRRGPYRIIASYRARTHALSRAVASASSVLFFLARARTYDPAKSQLVEISV